MLTKEELNKHTLEEINDLRFKTIRVGKTTVSFTKWSTKNLHGMTTHWYNEQMKLWGHGMPTYELAKLSKVELANYAFERDYFLSVKRAEYMEANDKLAMEIRREAEQRKEENRIREFQKSTIKADEEISDDGKKLLLSATHYIKTEEWQKAFDCISIAYRKEHAGRRSVASFRSQLREAIKNGANLGEMLHKAYALTGVDYFDDFMIALEWGRNPKQKFWLPRRRHLLSVCNALQSLEDGELDELFLSMPPRVGKSTIVNFFFIWVMLRNSERSNLYVSFTDKPIDTFYNGLLEILNDQDTYGYRDMFPASSVVKTDSKDHTLDLDRRKRYPSWTGRSLYGSLNGSCDCNGYLVGDDLLSGIEEALNPARLDNAWYRVDNNMITRAKENAKKLWIGTRWSLYDPIQRRLNLLETDSKFARVRYKVVNVPALDENDESNFDYSFGVGFSSDYYKQRRASFENNNDLASWEAQYMGAPIERAGTVFDPVDLRFYNGVLPGSKPDTIFMAVDPAWGGGDYCASPVIYQYDEDLFVHDVFYSNEDKTVTIPGLADKIVRNNVNTVFVEATRMTESFAEELNAELKKRNYKLTVQSTTNHWTGTGKEQRIFNKAPDIRAFMVFRDSGSRSGEYNKFMQNVFSFKIMGKNKHDDAPDSLCMAMSFIGQKLSNQIQLFDRVF